MLCDQRQKKFENTTSYIITQLPKHLLELRKEQLAIKKHAIQSSNPSFQYKYLSASGKCLASSEISPQQAN